MYKIKNFISRHSTWLVIISLSLVLLKPAVAEFKTILLILLIESVALALSGICAFAYTKIDFIRARSNSVLGYIFLGVHICVGLVVLGVYIAQYSN